MTNQYVSRVINLTHPEKNLIYNMTNEEATEVLRNGNPEAVRKIDGNFALVSVEGKTIRMARSIGRPLRYFIAKRSEGPNLIIAERIDTIFEYLKKEGLDNQFHPSYTRMVPAHYITRIELLGCPDPNPSYDRFFTPERNRLRNLSISEIGEYYAGTVYDEIKKWLRYKATTEPLGVSFSAGVDSGSIFLLTYHALKELGESPSRLKAFTLSIDGSGADLIQAREFLEKLGLEYFLEPVEADTSALDWKKAVSIVEDYKPLDIQSATMNLALLGGVRKRYPEWKFMLDGEGGDENLKDYPIEENPELTIKSVLNNLMLYHEGWGVNSIKHSLTYSSGLSRGYMRSLYTSESLGFDLFSPFTLPNVIEISEGIPYIDLTGWDHMKLYELKGMIVSQGVKKITGLDMPVFPKRRFQHGAVSELTFRKLFPARENDYRKEFLSEYE
jgi:asparagine synthase (glutamine-hydrolysing)